MNLTKLFNLFPQTSTTDLQKLETNQTPDHKHQWELASKTYAVPIKDHGLQVANISETILEKALLGLTTTLWKCLICPEFIQKEMLGSDEDTLDELMNKAEDYGPQYILQGDKTFVIARYIPQVQQAGNYPARAS